MARKEAILKGQFFLRKGDGRGAAKKKNSRQKTNLFWKWKGGIVMKTLFAAARGHPLSQEAQVKSIIDTSVRISADTQLAKGIRKAVA